MSQLDIIAPEVLTNSKLIDTNVPESAYLQWINTATYSKGDRAYKTSTHLVYESAIDGNTGKDPETDRNSWTEVGATNRWALFDKSITSQTANPLEISYQLRFGTAISNATFLNLTGAISIRLWMIDPTYGNVYDKTVDLRRLPSGASWWQWFFGRRTGPTQYTFDDLPTYPNADVYFTIIGGTALSIGVALFGVQRTFSLGVQYGASIGTNDYSRKERTQFGDVVVVPRAYARRASLQMMVLKSEVNELVSFLNSIRATPCLWIADDYYEPLTIYGFYKSYDVIISYPEYSVFSLDLEGLT